MTSRLSPIGRPLRNLTAVAMGDPPPDLEQRRAEAARRPSTAIRGEAKTMTPRKLAQK